MSLILAREAAFKAIFQLDFCQELKDEFEDYENLAIQNVVEEFPQLTENNLVILERNVKGTMAHLEEIDEIIQKNLKKGWTLKRLATADRNILRLAVYEMKFAEEKLSAGIAINEAVNLAKKYGTDNSGKFVNGILDAVSK
ncbi:MAG: transcription antitermination factor NusB [Selenomonadaceae bacterium]|nr:transcription antitermination factor NusB [Selenomonadaceae bacterium]